MKTNKLQLMNILITAAVLGFIVLHFVPYYSFTAKNIPTDDYSIFNFLWWRPTYLKKFGEEVYGKLHFDLNHSTTLLILAFVSALALLVLNITKPNSLGAEIVGVIWSGLTIFGYLTSDILRLQAPATENCFIKNPGLFWPIMILAFVGAALVLVRIVFFIPYYKQEKKKRKARGY